MYSYLLLQLVTTWCSRLTLVGDSCPPVAKVVKKVGNELPKALRINPLSRVVQKVL